MVSGDLRIKIPTAIKGRATGPAQAARSLKRDRLSKILPVDVYRSAIDAVDCNGLVNYAVLEYYNTAKKKKYLST